MKTSPVLLILGDRIGAHSSAHGQDSFSGVDLYILSLPIRERTPYGDRAARLLIMIDRQGTIPGLERYPQLKATYSTRFIKQRFRIFATSSQNFSFNLRARTYAHDYNQTLVHYLLEQRPQG
jgi:hypothetical protein